MLNCCDVLDGWRPARLSARHAFIIFHTPLKIQNDDRPPATEIDDFRCEWVNVSSGTSHPWWTRTKGRKTAVCVCVRVRVCVW